LLNKKKEEEEKKLVSTPVHCHFQRSTFKYFKRGSTKKKKKHTQG
jgi:hypothetical protein